MRKTLRLLLFFFILSFVIVTLKTVGIIIGGLGIGLIWFLFDKLILKLIPKNEKELQQEKPANRHKEIRKQTLKAGKNTILEFPEE